MYFITIIWESISKFRNTSWNDYFRSIFQNIEFKKHICFLDYAIQNVFLDLKVHSRLHIPKLKHVFHIM